MTGPTWGDVPTRRGALAAGTIGAAAMVNGGLNPRPMNAPTGLSAQIGVQPGATPQIVTRLVVSAAGNFTGVFVYSPSPGTGNLVASIAPAAGTDPFGNAYLAGITSYHAGVSQYAELNDSELLLKSALSSAIGAVSISGLAPFLGWLNFTGANGYVFDQAIVAKKAVFALNPSSPFGAEIWHDSTSLLQAGWAAKDAGGTIENLAYTLSAADNKVLLQGTIHQTSATPSATILTLPAAYQPAVNQFVGVTNFTGAAAPGAIVEINTTGDVLAPLPLPGNGNDCVFNIFYRLT